MARFRQRRLPRREHLLRLDEERRQALTLVRTPSDASRFGVAFRDELVYAQAELICRPRALGVHEALPQAPQRRHDVQSWSF